MARTTDGRPVLLRYDDVDAALRHPGLATFSVQSLLDHNGIASGPLREWCDLLMLSLEGDDHGRLRGLVNNAQGVSPKVPLLDKTDDMLARAAGKRVMVGGIDSTNVDSIRFHERLGFVEVARMPGIGEKFGRRLDLVLVQLSLEG